MSTHELLMTWAHEQSWATHEHLWATRELIMSTHELPMGTHEPRVLCLLIMAHTVGWVWSSWSSHVMVGCGQRPLFLHAGEWHMSDHQWCMSGYMIMSGSWAACLLHDSHHHGVWLHRCVYVCSMLVLLYYVMYVHTHIYIYDILIDIF